MAKDSSFDIVSEFDFQELRNAVDQAIKEITTRYDFKGVKADLDLQSDQLVIKTEDEMKLNAIHQVLLTRLASRKLSPKILDFGEVDHALGGTVKQNVALVQALDTENAKKISKLIREEFKKTVKPTIQGDSIRVVSKNRDDLQAVQRFLKEREDIEIPLVYNNYR